MQLTVQTAQVFSTNLLSWQVCVVPVTSQLAQHILQISDTLQVTRLPTCLHLLPYTMAT